MKKMLAKFGDILAAIIGAVILGGGVYLAFTPVTAISALYTIPGAAALAFVFGLVFAWRRSSADKTVHKEAMWYVAAIFAVLGAALGALVEFVSQFQLLISGGASLIGALFAFGVAKRIAAERRLKRSDF